MLSLYASQRMVELLSNVNHQIASTLLESIRFKNSFPVSYIDFGESNDTVSFITPNKFDDIANSEPQNWRSLVWKDKRSEMKVGKLVRMFYGEMFPVNHPKGKPMVKPPIDIESFVNKFKAERDKDVNYDRFEIINGEDFHYWYNQGNYSRFVHEETTLGRSCLRYAESSDFLKMYSQNPHIFRMLILKDDNGRLRGRANLWKLDEPEGRIYMDRIYYVNDYDVELFKDYAKRNGWLHKEQQTFGWNRNIVDTRNGNVHEWNEMIMKVKLRKYPPKHYKHYPYIDTLSIYDPRDRTLTNDGRLRTLQPYLVLTDYQGSYHTESDDRERVFSRIYNDYIPREEATFVEIDDTWVYNHDAVYVHNSGGRKAYNGSDKIVRSHIIKTKYFLKEDCVFSEYLDTYIYKESAITAYLDADKKKEVLIHKKLIGRGFAEKNGVVIKEKEKKGKKARLSPSRKAYADHMLSSIMFTPDTDIRVVLSTVPPDVASYMIERLEALGIDTSSISDQHRSDHDSDDGDSPQEAPTMDYIRGLVNRVDWAIPHPEPERETERQEADAPDTRRRRRGSRRVSEPQESNENAQGAPGSGDDEEESQDARNMGERPTIDHTVRLGIPHGVTGRRAWRDVNIDEITSRVTGQSTTTSIDDLWSNIIVDITDDSNQDGQEDNEGNSDGDAHTDNNAGTNDEE